MTSLLLCYGIALLLIAAGLGGGAFLLKKKLHVGIFCLGVISTVALFFVILLLFRLTFGTDQYYNTPFFRTMVGFVFLALLWLLWILIVKSAFFNRYKEAEGLSFCFGFGAAPALFMGIYLLIMLPVVGFNGLFNGPCEVAEEGYLTFADNTIITVFRPAAGHISFAVTFLLFAMMTLSTGILLRKICEEKIRTGVIVGWTILAVALNAAAVLPLPFFAMYGLDHWQLAVLSAVLALIHVLLVIFIPKIPKDATYTKQFE